MLNQVKDLNSNLGLGLTQLQQNVNTVGEVAANNSPATSAGSANARAAPAGPPWTEIVIAAAAVAGLYLINKK